MCYIRQARYEDVERIAEIVIFNYRLNFFPIFQNDEFYFEELRVSRQIPCYEKKLDHIWVYDDGVVKGFVQMDGQEVKKLFVEPVLQGKSIGSALLAYVISEQGANSLWALEKNFKAIRFYERHGFVMTNDKKYEEDTTEYLIRMERS